MRHNYAVCPYCNQSVFVIGDGVMARHNLPCSWQEVPLSSLPEDDVARIIAEGLGGVVVKKTSKKCPGSDVRWPDGSWPYQHCGSPRRGGKRARLGMPEDIRPSFDEGGGP